MTEPTIITILRLDHGRGEHTKRPNSACPKCPKPQPSGGSA